ncbi:MAG TPA: YibE/F family protein [Lachnospiraceae bacterium]
MKNFKITHKRLLFFKERPFFSLALILYLLLLIFTNHNAFLYKTPIAKIISVDTQVEKKEISTRKGEEYCYRQTIGAVLLNGKQKGQKVILKNTYHSSQLIDHKYHKNDKVLLNINKNTLTGSIKSLKRDVFLLALLGALLLLLLLISKKSGLLTILTILTNLILYSLGFFFFLNGKNVVFICNILAFLFSVTTLLFLNGFHRKTFCAILSTLLVLFIIIKLFDFALFSTSDLDYANMEYLGSLHPAEDFFKAEILFAGLGAIMDVCVTISSSLSELLKRNPKLSFSALFSSGKAIGSDIMGTMINVLLFVFASGLIPTFLLYMNNSYSFFSIAKNYIPYEIIRFLVEGIGIVVSIPISILISSVFLRKKHF